MSADPDDPRERFTDALLGNGNHDDAWEIAYTAGYAAALNVSVLVRPNRVP